MRVTVTKSAGASTTVVSGVTTIQRSKPVSFEWSAMMGNVASDAAVYD
jgi:hypothetical protein